MICGLSTLIGRNWTRKLIPCLCILLIAGCDPVEEKDYLDLTEKTQLGAYVSLAVVTSDPEPDGGGGKLKVGDECPDCLGRGMVGDGTIENKCNRCNGTGKIQAGDPDVAAMSLDDGETWLTNAEVSEWYNKNYEHELNDTLAQSGIDPSIIAQIKSALKRYIENLADSAMENHTKTPPPPTFAPTQEDRQAGNVLPWSPEGGADPSMESPENGNLPKLPSQKGCLCGPECACGGNCDPCNCIFCKLPDPGPGPLLSEEPLIASYVYKDGIIYEKNGEELKPVE